MPAWCINTAEGFQSKAALSWSDQVVGGLAVGDQREVIVMERVLRVATLLGALIVVKIVMMDLVLFLRGEGTVDLSREIQWE